MMRFQFAAYLLACVAAGAPIATSHAQTTPRTRARLFWQDNSDKALYWGDLKKGDDWMLERTEIRDFPELDAERQSHVQMQHSDGIVVSGIHDAESGEFQSGWVAISTGAEREEHGDHFHWRYRKEPSVLCSRLDEHQGNPAHVYLYDGEFFLANDKKNGFTRLTKPQLRAGQTGGKFFGAGGGHITLATASRRVAYSSWIDREGDHAGQVDVVSLDVPERRYSFHLPSGVIHGATANSGKVFLAPSDGVCWVSADKEVRLSPEKVLIHHISLGKTAEDTPKRTGAFCNIRHFVLCTTGRGKESELCILNAKQAKPVLHKLKLPAEDGASTTTPVGFRSSKGLFALLAEEYAEGEHAERLHVIALDPDGDGDGADSKIVASVEIGASLIEGHSGRHSISPVGSRYVVVTNPGDGTVTVLSPRNWTVLATLKIGGSPGRMLAIGG